MKLVQPVGSLTAQFQEIIFNAIDKRQFIDMTTPGADVEFSIDHNLGVIPLGYLVTRANKACAVYEGVSAWDTVKIYLRCNVATAALRVLIF